MEPVKVLGAIDVNGQPQKPVYAFGPVLAGGRGKNLPSKKNHADYISGMGYYDAVNFFGDHALDFLSLNSVFVGETAPHLSTEVDCESLFSMAGYKSHPSQSQTDIRNYERLVVAKHRMSRIYCDPSLVHKTFMDRFKTNSWDEKDERDDTEFLEIEKEIYLKTFPHMKELVDEESEGEGDGANEKGDGGVIEINDGESSESEEEESDEDASSDSSSASSGISVNSC